MSEVALYRAEHVAAQQPLHAPPPGPSPPWRQRRGKWMVSLVNTYTNANPKRWYLWEIDLRFALDSTPGWFSDLSPDRLVFRFWHGDEAVSYV